MSQALQCWEDARRQRLSAEQGGPSAALNPAPDNYLGKISSDTFVSWREPGYIILRAVSCLVARQEGPSWDCFQCGCYCSSIEQTILGRSFGKVLGDFQHFGSVTESSYCFLYSALLPPSSASLGRHLPSAWHWGCVSTRDLGAALWFQPSQAVQGKMPLQSCHQCPRMVKCILLTNLPLQNFLPYRNSLSPTFPRWWCKGNLYKSVCCGIELRPIGRSNVSKLTGLLLATTSNA